MELISNYPWYYTLLCFVAGFVFSALLYFRDKQNENRSKTLLYILFGLRFFSVSVIALLLLNIFIKHYVNEVEKPLIIIAQDNSSSIVSLKDSGEIKSNYVQQLLNFSKNINEKFETRIYQFDSEVTRTDKFNFEGKETDLSNLFLDIENNYANKNIGAIVLATDGIYNKGTNPLNNISKFNAPIYTIALGDTTPLKDIWIQTINHNQVAYLGNSFPVEVIINATDMQNESVQVTISNNGKVISTNLVKINSNNFSSSVNFMVDALKPGIQKYQIAVTCPEKDKNKQNNNQSFVIDIIDNRDKILILADAPHPDILAISQSIESTQTYEVEVSLLKEFNKPLKPYSLIILHQIAALPIQVLNEIKNNKQSVFFIGNNVLNFSTGLNVRKDNDSRKNIVEASYANEFTLFNISNELKNFINQFPGVTTNFLNTISNNGVNSLITQKIGVVQTDVPLMFFNELNNTKTAGFIGDGLWRWKMRDYLEHNNHNLFDELIQKTVQYLSVKADKSFFRVFTKKIINETEPIEFTAEVYNQSYELITEPDVQLTLKDENGKIYNYTFSKKQSIYYLSAGEFEPGEYTYEAKVKYADKFYTKSGSILIKEIVSEKINTVANHHLLNQMSVQSGGKLFYRTQINELEKQILNNNAITSISYSHKQLNDLINLKWIFGIILFLLSIEWYIRKHNGSV
jgi:hypothetical protein